MSVNAKQLIKDTFISLLEDRPLAQITVKDIVASAGINRNTFYLHYETTDDVLKEIQSRHISEYIEKVKDLTYTED